MTAMVGTKRLARRISGACALVVLSACGKLPLEAKVVGYKPGTGNVVVLHVKTQKNAYLTCSGEGVTCGSTSLDYKGESDLEVTLQPGHEATKTTVFLESKAGPRRANLAVDLAAAKLPPNVHVEDSGDIACLGRKCKGALTFAPGGHLELDTEPGVVVQLGGDKLTAPASGKIDAPVSVKTTPPLEKLSLEDLCASSAKPLGTTTLRLDFPDGEKASAEIPLDTERVVDPLRRAMKRIGADGKVLFSWETARTTIPAKERAALYLGESRCATAGPDGATLVDVLVVAVAESTDTRESTCTYQVTGKSSGVDHGTATGKITMTDANVVAYDRLTGKKLASRKFVATKTCSSSLDLSHPDHVPDQYASVPASAIAIWAKNLAK